MGGFIGYLVSQAKTISKIEKEKLKENIKNMKYRGKNYKKTYINEYIRLGYSSSDRLNKDKNYEAISHGNKNYQIVFDGIIYNNFELRKRLKKKGYIFHSESDREVLLALYKEKGEDFLHDLRGVFSFVIWDEKRKKLFGARDRFGSKPFYYTENKEAFYFSSTVENLFPWQELKLNLETFHHYLSYQYVPGAETIQENIYELEPGHYFYKKWGQDLKIKAYASLDFMPRNTTIKKEVNKIQDVLRESVHLHMEAEHPVGAFLSGGVDSSAIVAFAKEKNPNIPTFTVGFQREGFSEIDIARKTAEKLDVIHHYYEISSQEFIQVLPQVIQKMGDPVADPAAVPLYIAAREAKKNVDTILSGEGADELFGGYEIYREPKSLKIFDYIPKVLQNNLQKMAKLLPKGVRGKSFIERGTTPLKDRFIGNAKIFTEEEKRKLIKDYQSDYQYKNISHPLYDKVSHYSDIHKMQYIDLHTWAPGDILVKADRMSMAHGLNLRSPFFDKEVFKVVSKIPSELTVTKTTTKSVLREALHGIVPDSVLYNKKLGFPVPLKYWLKNDLAGWAVEIIQKSPTDHLINKSYVYELLRVHQSNEYDYSREIWTILVFMIWYEYSFLPALILN